MTASLAHFRHTLRSLETVQRNKKTGREEMTATSPDRHDLLLFNMRLSEVRAVIQAAKKGVSRRPHMTSEDAAERRSDVKEQAKQRALMSCVENCVEKAVHKLSLQNELPPPPSPSPSAAALDDAPGREAPHVCHSEDDDQGSPPRITGVHLNRKRAYTAARV